MKNVLCIFRAVCFSPGMIERDEAILRTVASRLQTAGYPVSLIHEENLTLTTPMPTIVLHMARSPHALDILMRWEDAGCHVLNPVNSIRNVERETLARLCTELAIPTPKTWIVDTANHGFLTVAITKGHTDEFNFPCWVKCTGSCAQQADDVCLVYNIKEYEQILIGFHDRHIERAIVMEHLEGPCIKFYAVRGTGFFYYLPSDHLEYDKWNRLDKTTECKYEASPSLKISDSFFSNSTKELIAKLQEIDKTYFPIVYGGDAIIGTDGIARLIDLNDWPSFSVCRNEAAEAIIQLIEHSVQN